MIARQQGHLFPNDGGCKALEVQQVRGPNELTGQVKFLFYQARTHVRPGEVSFARGAWVKQPINRFAGDIARCLQSIPVRSLTAPLSPPSASSILSILKYQFYACFLPFVFFFFKKKTNKKSISASYHDTKKSIRREQCNHLCLGNAAQNGTSNSPQCSVRAGNLAKFKCTNLIR